MRVSSSTSYAYLDAALKKLVSVASVTGEQEQADLVIQVAKELLGKQPGLQYKNGVIGGYPYLTVTTRKPDRNTIWFVIHLDVIPGEKQLFTVRSDTQNYYGRGVFDMKGMAASVIAALVGLKQPLKTNVGFLFTTDEEVGGRNGVGALITDQFQGAAVFVFDQSSHWVLQERMKGALWLQIIAEGKAAHGARPWLGTNANEELIEFLAAFKTWHRKNLVTSHPDNYYTTLNVGTVQGGQATNQVSDHAEATLDIRFVSEIEAQKIIAAAKRIAHKCHGISITELIHDPCVETDVQEQWFQKTKSLLESLAVTIGGGGGERFGHGTTDGRYFAPTGVPVISTRPPGGGQHGPEEWVSKQGLYDLQELCSRLMEQTR